MKIEKTEITPQTGNHVSVIKREESFFQSPFHFHPELELVYVKESFGKRIVGNNVENFEAGDLVFLGSNVPHVWLNDEIYYTEIATLKATSIVAYFNKDIFGPLFYKLEQTSSISDLFQRAKRGMRITGETNKIIIQKLEELLKKTGFEIIVGLFEILNIIANSNDITLINADVYQLCDDNVHNNRLNAVFKYIQDNYNEDISLASISTIANLTPPSFCRLFKSKTKKHFIEYLNEVRVSNACKSLLESDKSISEIAYNCGYKTIANFNKIFKKITGLTPKEYKHKAAV